MVTALVVFGCLCLLAAGHPFVTYPWSLVVLQALYPVKKTGAQDIPQSDLTCAICVCAYNEERVIATGLQAINDDMRAAVFHRVEAAIVQRRRVEQRVDASGRDLAHRLNALRSIRANSRHLRLFGAEGGDGVDVAHAHRAETDEPATEHEQLGQALGTLAQSLRKISMPISVSG